MDDKTKQPEAEKAAAPPKPAKPPVEATAEKPAFKPRPLAYDRWALAEHRNPGHWICAETGTTIEHLLDPAYFANIARNLQPMTTIQVHWDDATQYAELYVLAAGRNWASVDVLFHKQLAHPEARQLTEQYEISFNGPVDKFRVLRLSDRAVIKAGFASEQAARVWLDEYKRKLTN